MNPWATLLYTAVLGKSEGLAGLEPDDWTALLEHARQEELGGLLYQRCLAAGVEVPAPVADQLRERYWSVADHTLVGLCELGEVLEGLAEEELEVLVLPGAALLPLYPDPGCRPMDDFDLLVRPLELPRVRAWLRARGFSHPPRHEDLWARRNLVLDLHADLINCSRIEARRHAGWMDIEEVWQDRTSVTVEGVLLATMCREDMVLYTAVHALRHSFRRFTWFLDLYFLLREGLDWERLMNKAQRYGLQRPLLYSVRFLQHKLHLDLPAPVLAWTMDFPLSPGEESLLEWSFRNRQEGEWGDLLWSFNIAGLMRRYYFLAATFFPGPAVLLQVFPYLPRVLFPLAYGLRVGQLLLRGSRQLAGLVRSF